MQDVTWIFVLICLIIAIGSWIYSYFNSPPRL